MSETTADPARREAFEDAADLLRTMWPLMMREHPAPFLKMEAQTRAWAITGAAARGAECLWLSIVCFAFACAGVWPLGLASLGFSLAGTYHVRRVRALRRHWTSPRFWPLAVQTSPPQDDGPVGGNAETPNPHPQNHHDRSGTGSEVKED